MLTAAAQALFKYKRGAKRPSVRAVAKQHGVPRSTLGNFINRGGRVAKRGRPTALTEAEELQLVNIVKGAQAQGRGVTRLDLLGAVQRACEVRVSKGLPHPFPQASPSSKWISAFMSRHGLSMRKASPQTKARRAAAESQHALTHWYDTQLMPALQKRCNSRQTYLERPDRVFNADETGFQPQSNERVLAETGSKHVFQAAAANPKHSITCVAWGSADGQVLAPNYINAGTMLTANALGGVRFFPNSAIILKPKTHMMDGSVFPKLLVSMAKQVPGGVSIRNRVLLILDGHASRFSADTKGTAAALGFDLLILPGQCTHFLQPWDQLFSSVKASHGKLVSGAAQLAGSGGFRPTLPQRISMIDSALHFSVGFSREPLKRAFAKTGLYPPNKEQLLAAAKASIQGGKGMATLAPWKRLTVTNDMMDAAVRRSAEEQPPLYFRAVDQFYNRQELEEQVSTRAAKYGGGARVYGGVAHCDALTYDSQHNFL
ncbi:hypothetical protein QJQ45_012983 [Haematococcus lacustris]|nr:hypothetical protein QJQ45_012983 [Haematococcus lacustris]